MDETALKRREGMGLVAGAVRERTGSAQRAPADDRAVGEGKAPGPGTGAAVADQNLATMRKPAGRVDVAVGHEDAAKSFIAVAAMGGVR